jgi:hypothetical protein
MISPVRCERKSRCTKELAAAALRGAHFPDFTSAVQFVISQALKYADGRMDGTMGRAVWAPAIPSTVGHLLLQQVAGYWFIPVTHVSLRRVHFAQIP